MKYEAEEEMEDADEVDKLEEVDEAMEGGLAIQTTSKVNDD